ncbi:putative salicylate hydroxylase [Biscogniauxia mediterranea]|nr:putative salicylate hydroxylase [Biscogniauxia mediterranea]
MEFPSEDGVCLGRHAIRPLKVVVVGAGIGGLAVGLGMRKTGHDVVILEKVKQVTEVGAGIQVAPNAARILRRFGVLEEVMEHACVLERNSLRRYDNDDELGSVPLSHVEKEYGAPIAVIHRADLQHILLEAFRRCGGVALTNHKVIEVNSNFEPRVLVDHEGTQMWFSGDVIIAADGMNSTIRRQIAAACHHDDRLIPTGVAAYRILLPRELVQNDDRVASLFEENMGLRYMGPGGHIMAYPIRKNAVYNVVLLYSDDSRLISGTEACDDPKPSWTKRGSKDKMRQFYNKWSPVVQGLIDHAAESEILETSMNDLPPLPCWVKGQVALAGDSCHLMLPFVAQGAANAIEDAGTLTAAFTCTDNVGLALKVYEAVRKERGEKIQASATATGKSLHLPDGEEQRKRDREIMMASRGDGRNPDRWNDREWNQFMWGVDVMRETIENWQMLTATVMPGHRSHL